MGLPVPALEEAAILALMTWEVPVFPPFARWEGPGAERTAVPPFSLTTPTMPPRTSSRCTGSMLSDALLGSGVR